MLALCETVEEVAELGCLMAQARVLYKKVQDAKASGGVSMSLLSPPPGPTGPMSSTSTSSVIMTPTPAPVGVPRSVPPATTHASAPGKGLPFSLHHTSASFTLSTKLLFHHWCGCGVLLWCAAVPLISRPSEEEFLRYVKKGKTEKVAQALRHYPDLVNVKDKTVSDLWYSHNHCMTAAT